MGGHIIKRVTLVTLALTVQLSCGALERLRPHTLPEPIEHISGTIPTTPTIIPLPPKLSHKALPTIATSLPRTPVVLLKEAEKAVKATVPILKTGLWDRIIETSLERLAAAETFHFSIDGVLEITGGSGKSTLPVKINGSYKSPDSIEIRMTIETGLFVLDTRAISINGTLYTNNLKTASWQEEPSQGVRVQFPLELALDQLGMLGNLTPVGQEKIGAESVTHLRGFIAKNQLLPELTGKSVHLWIVNQTKDIRKIEAKVPIDIRMLGTPFKDIQNGAVTTLDMQLTIYGYGDSVEISPPQTGYSEPVSE